MNKAKGILVVGAGLVIAIAGVATAAVQHQAKATHASDDVARKLDVVASLLMDAEGNVRGHDEVATAARELLAIQTVLAGQELPGMSEEARRRVMTIVNQVEERDEVSRIGDEGVMRWAATTRECMLTSSGPQSCGLELPQEITSN